MIIAIGAFLNALGILLGAMFGLTLRKPISAQRQLFFRNALGCATIVCAAILIYQSISGTFLSCLKQFFIAMLAVVIGNLLGKVLKFQKTSNYFGRIAGSVIAAAQKAPQSATNGFNASAILFCFAPLGILGAIVDGLSGYFYFLGLKAFMDALTMVSFVKMFRWPSALSAVPVFAIFNGISFAVQIYAKPFLDSHALTNSVNATAGIITLVISVVIFEMRKVALTNYLPALVIAPLLTWLFK